MMAKKPMDLPVGPDNNMALLRFAIIGELDAVNLYEQIIKTTDNDDIVLVINDIIREEKTHIGELQTLLLELDNEQDDELVFGKNEVRNLTK